ncbi:clostripain-related cysteine peptidase [Clostridium paridis]|uniref:Clostripain n=1 Tax=Clostridium paridis TaxID=2803863 RepID=A0A937FE41_9CLOT|nr:clostripain-related cysteine peptidase [Clostridium paridis]MBL4930303.1 clostripain [Clostridium paridis]
MNKIETKDWTILIYANGNNDLSSIMLKSKISAEKIGSTKSVNVVMQISRESSELLSILKPATLVDNINEYWTGVRRYYIQNPNSKLLSDLGNICMADPNNLYEFIKWGIENYPSNHYALILSDHGGGFIAAMPDLSQDRPYMMGIYDLCKAINLIYQDIGVQIDILMFDMCFMNTLEIIYELGKEKINTVKSVLTYIKTGPLEGLNYYKLVKFFDENHNELNNKLFLKNLIDDLNSNLVALDIDYDKLTKLKELVSSMAYFYLKNNNCNSINTSLNYTITKKSFWHMYKIEFEEKLNDITIYNNKFLNDKNNTLNVIDLTTKHNVNKEVLSKYEDCYYKLAFAKDNYWFNLLFDKPIDYKYESSLEESTLNPFKLDRYELLKIITAVNPSYNEEEKELILKRLCSYKKWTNLK